MALISIKPSLFTVVLTVAQAAIADQPDAPPLHFFTVPSQANTCFAVHCLRPWDGSADVLRNGRLQLFRSNTGAELWRIEGMLCYEQEVFPADDLNHLAIIRCYIASPSLDTAPVVLFYFRGNLIKSYTLKEIGFDLSKLEKSVSHASFAATKHVSRTWQWYAPPGSEQAEIEAMDSEPNPRWVGGILELSTLDGQRLRFDGASGNRLR